MRIDHPDASVTTYAYDALGRRIEKDVAGTATRYVYDGAAILLEYDGANVLQARYSHGNNIDQPLAVERDGSLAYYQVDHLGSVRFLINVAGTVVNSYDYDSYGRLESSIETISQPYRFTGREYDAESGNYYYRARYYDPAMGRFLTEDPLGFAAGDANFYRYVFGNPLNATDPSGLDCVAVNGNVTCTVPNGGPTIDFPRPPGWPDSINSNSINYHYYNIVVPLNGASADCVMDGIVDNPTLGSPNPATPDGTPNNATPVRHHMIWDY